MTRKQRERLAKGRENFMAQVRLSVETSTSGSVRPTHKPHRPYLNLAPKTGYFTKGVKSGPITSVAI